MIREPRCIYHICLWGVSVAGYDGMPVAGAAAPISSAFRAFAVAARGTPSVQTRRDQLSDERLDAGPDLIADRTH